MILHDNDFDSYCDSVLNFNSSNITNYTLEKCITIVKIYTMKT